MASFRQRPGPGGRRVWQVRIKKKGYQEQARTFDLKTEGERWAKQVEAAGESYPDTVERLAGIS